LITIKYGVHRFIVGTKWEYNKEAYVDDKNVTVKNTKAT